MKTESTPFAILEVITNDDQKGPIWAKFYWSANSGVYGHQVITEYNAGNGFKTYKTNGCGYCKKSAALEHFLKEVTGKYQSLGGDLGYFLGRTKYHKGGNCYELNYSDLTKIDKLK